MLLFGSVERRRERKRECAVSAPRMGALERKGGNAFPTPAIRQKESERERESFLEEETRERERERGRNPCFFTL